MTFTVPATSPKAPSAAAFGRELVRALEARGVSRSELHRATGIGRTALDNYRTGSSLPRTEAAAAIAAALDWPRLAAIVAEARSKTCARCGRRFRNDGGNMGAKRYCSVTCRETAASERLASKRTRQAGQTGDGRRRYQALARLRSGIRIAEELAGDLRAAIAAMCADCEPEGRCRIASCPLRPFSPLPLATHAAGAARTAREVSAASWTPRRRSAAAAVTRQLHADGRIRSLPPGHRGHPANDPDRREAWLSAMRSGKASKGATGQKRTPEQRERIAEAVRASYERRRAASSGSVA